MRSINEYNRADAGESIRPVAWLVVPIEEEPATDILLFEQQHQALLDEFAAADARGRVDAVDVAARSDLSSVRAGGSIPYGTVHAGRNFRVDERRDGLSERVDDAQSDVARLGYEVLDGCRRVERIREVLVQRVLGSRDRRLSALLRRTLREDVQRAEGLAGGVVRIVGIPVRIAYLQRDGAVVIARDVEHRSGKMGRRPRVGIRRSAAAYVRRDCSNSIDTGRYRTDHGERGRLGNVNGHGIRAVVRIGHDEGVGTRLVGEGPDAAVWWRAAPSRHGDVGESAVAENRCRRGGRVYRRRTGDRGLHGIGTAVGIGHDERVGARETREVASA